LIANAQLICDGCVCGDDDGLAEGGSCDEFGLDVDGGDGGVDFDGLFFEDFGVNGEFLLVCEAGRGAYVIDDALREDLGVLHGFG